MALHPDSELLSRYIKETSSQLIPALDHASQMSSEANKSGVTSADIINAGFWYLAMYLNAVDFDVANEEIDLMRDVLALFRKIDTTSDSSLIKQSIFNQYKNDSSLYKLRVPTALPVLIEYDKLFGTNKADMARAMYFRFANALVKADGKITDKEANALTEIKLLLYPDGYKEEEKYMETSQLQETSFLPEKQQTVEELLAKLNSLVGLNAVKDDVVHLVNFLRIQKMREAQGIPPVPISRHLIFYGNPGTGKTTVARLLAEVYKSLNILRKGHLVETDRAGLVAGYVGQTAIKVKEVVENALGGILFIDEAYTLAGESQDFGREAVDTLIKLMEDNRNDLIVIVAGYPDKMEKFIKTNPGLSSRFNKYFSFQDYTPQQLLQIFEGFCKDSNYYLTSEAKEKTLLIFQLHYDTRDEAFGNARLARNIFEQTISRHANRIIYLLPADNEVMSKIEAVDVPGDVQLNSIIQPFVQT